MTQINQAADAADEVLRISMDAKATVKVGPFARGGKSRTLVTAAEHDFAPDATMTPVGIFLPALDDLFIDGVTATVTSDCWVDRLGQWWETVCERYAPITTLVLNLDNGPEHHRRRTPFMQRLVDVVQRYRVNKQLQRNLSRKDFVPIRGSMSHVPR